MTKGPSHVTLRTDVIDVLVADDQFLVREGVTAALAKVKDIRVIGAAADATELRRLFDATHPRVVVTDIRMPPGYGIEGIKLAHELRAQDAEIGVVILSQYAEPEYAIELFRDGSDRLGYLLKERMMDVAELARGVRAVAAGASVLDQEVVESLVVQHQRRERSRRYGLTTREYEVLSLIAAGFSNGAIARKLVVSERGIAKHVNSIFRKLGLGDAPDQDRRVAAVLMHLGRTTQ